MDHGHADQDLGVIVTALLFTDVERPQTPLGRLEGGDLGSCSFADGRNFGLIEQADRIGKSALATQQDLAEQIEHLGQVQEWAVKAAVELQKQAATAIKNLEAERAQLQASRTGLERNAVQAIQNAVRSQTAEIERHTTQALATPLHAIGQAAAQVRQNIKEISWLVRSLILAAGVVIGLALGWLPFRSSLNHLQEQEDRIEQYLATQQQQQAAPVTPEPSHAPAHKGKK